MPSEHGWQDAKGCFALPICRKPTVKAHRPFCSKRCADLDLGRWLKGGYVVPGDPAEEDFPENPADWEKS